jgi:hypothetical protein
MKLSPVQLDLADIINQNFVGARMNPKTGQAYIDLVYDGSPVELPDAIPTATGYRTFFWTKNSMNFSINNKGHLIVSII